MYARKLPLAALLLVSCLFGLSEGGWGLPPQQSLNGAERRARVQPTVPPEYREVPFVESAPKPELTDQQRQRGYLLFQRPITQPVYPNTHPLPHERLEQLSAFATPGEYEPVTLSLYPVRALENLCVRVSDLQCGAHRITSDEAEVRLATYWNVGFPRYTSRDTYRRLPELLERVTVHSCPAGECQRWWLTMHIPEDAPPGLYHGQVTITEDGNEQPMTVPLTLRVLSFPLQSDPGKHYSVYYYTRNNVIFRNQPESFVERATGNEYAAMIRFGIDTLPTMSLQTDASGQRIELRDDGELDRMLAAGLRGPLPLTAGNVIGRIYRDTTPGGKRESHWLIDTMPPPEFYERITEMFADFERLRKARGWPAVVCCPIDEVASSRSEFGAQVYAAVKQAGIRTYATKNPLAADAAAYRPYVDVWCSQPYSTSYEQIQEDTQHEFWCYPNHNAGEIKDRRVMCKGGRMTYGFGFWRSGYTTLIPWHWAWTPAPDQFDYLRGERSGCGQRIGDDGEVIPAVYWECFREGRDDARYLYTLQQAVWEREGTTSAKCQQAVDQGKRLLQQTWAAIEVQQKYLADGMWPDTEFQARRWQLAQAIEALREFPASRQGAAPSVLVQRTTVDRPVESSVIDDVVSSGQLESRDLGEGFAHWRNSTKEGQISLTREASPESQAVGMRWQVGIDHQTDGGEGGKYPVGWPRVARTFAPGQLDLTRYDFLEFLVRVDSDRDEVADDSTMLGVVLSSHKSQQRLFESSFDLGDRQRVWIPLRLSIKDMIAATGTTATPWQSISRVQLYLRESDYADGTQLTFDIAQVRLLRLTSPVVSGMDLPRFVLLPSRSVPVILHVLGAASGEAGSYRMRLELLDQAGNTCRVAQQPLTTEPLVVLDTSELLPGPYQVRAQVLTPDDDICSRFTAALQALAGPLFVGQASSLSERK